MAASTKLWITCAVLAAAVLAVPPTRDVVWRVDLALSLHSQYLGDPTEFVMLRRGHGGGAPSDTVARLNQAWAWAGAATHRPAEERWAMFQRALALDPNDEATLVARACLSVQALGPDAETGVSADRSKVGDERQAVAAAEELTERCPDNAVGWYLRAYNAQRAGASADARRWLRRGNEARYLWFAHEVSVARLAWLSQRGGQPELESWLAAQSGALFPEFARLRALARGLMVDCRAVQDGDHAREAEDLRRDVARLGARLRDQADTYIAALVGQAVQSMAFADGTPTPAELKQQDGVQQNERLARWRAETIAARLRQAGLEDRGAWVRAQTERGLAVRRAILQSQRHATVSPASDRALHRIRAVTVTAWSLLAMAGVLCLSALRGGGPGRARLATFRWRAVELGAVWTVCVLPAVVLAGAAAATPWGPTSLPWHAAGLTLAAIWPVLALWLLHLWLAARYARRLGGGSAWRMSFWSRSWRPCVQATAAFLVLVSLSLAVPAALLRHQAAGAVAGMLQHEAAVVRQAVQSVPVP